MQGTSFWFSRFVVEPIVLLVLAFPAAAILFGPSPRVTSQNLDIAQKAQRPQFVPGEALVRFKPGRAFEGRMSVAVPNGDQLISRESSSSHSIEMTPEQVQVTLDRFEGSAIVDGLRIARMAPEDTRKAVRCAEGCLEYLFHPGPTVRIHTSWFAFILASSARCPLRLLQD